MFEWSCAIWAGDYTRSSKHDFHKLFYLGFTALFWFMFHFRMQFVFAIPLISMLLIFQLVSSQTCENANWWRSLDRKGWSKCPQTNTYLKGLWRADYKKGDERVGRIEVGKCCQADESSYTLQAAICSNANWKTLLDRWVIQIWC